MSRRPTRPGRRDTRPQIRGDEDDLEANQTRESDEVSAKVQIPSRKRDITPFRLVILGGLILIIGTLYVQLESSRRDQAEVDLKSSLTQAEAARLEGDFRASAEHLKKACLALDLLKRNDDRSKIIRQNFREITAANGLVQGSLIAAIDRLPSRPDEEVPGHWNSDGNIIEKNWIVMETMISRENDGNGGQRTVIDCQMAFEQKTYQFENNLPLLENLPLGEEPLKVVFAAQLQSCRPLETNSNVWMIQIRPETAFLWTDINLYQSIGFHSDDPVTQRGMHDVFQRQSRLMGLNWESESK